MPFLQEMNPFIPPDGPEHFAPSVDERFPARIKTPALVQIYVFLAAALVIIDIFAHYFIPNQYHGWAMLISAIGVILLVSFGIFALNRVYAQAGRLKELINIDNPTGLYSSVFLMEELDRLIEEGTKSLVIIFLDLDELKCYNDKYGHRAGDKLIRGSAEALAEAIVGHGVGFRYGGDEFVAILPDISIDTALRLAKLVKANFGERKISASIGLYAWKPGMTSDDLLFEADKSMYAAKHAGKNRIFFGGEELSGTAEAIQEEIL